MARRDKRRSAELGTERLGPFIRHQRGAILAEWERLVRALPIAAELERPALIDHIPDVLERIADLADGISRGEPGELPHDLADTHALERLEEGFDLPQVVAEYAVLRDCIMRQWEEAAWDPAQLVELRAVNQAIDTAVSASVGRFTRARDRTLVALDRIATEAMESRDLDDLLHRLLGVFVQTTGSVDTATILLREGDRLRVRATIGLPEDRGYSLAIGEGFAGRIAAERAPLALRNGSADPLVQSEALRAKGLRALYGVPLLDGELIGVAHMGSQRAQEFSRQDMRLFGAMATRASAVINQHLLRETAEKTAAELATVLESMRERELEFRTLAESIPQLAWIADGSGSIYWFNQRWFDFTGTTLEQVRGWGWKRVQHPDHLQRVVEKLALAVQRGEAYEDTFPMLGRDGRYRWFLTRAVPIRDEGDRVVRWFGTNTDVTEQRFLAEATALLTSSLDTNTTLHELANLAVPALADWCVVDVLERGRLERLAIAHSDPARSRALTEWSRHIALDTPVALERVLRTGKPLLFPVVTPEVVAIYAPGETYERLWRQMRVHSCIVAPIAGSRGPLGTIVLFQSESTRTYGAADVEVAVELGRRAGIAMENARLYTQAQEAIRARDEMLAIVSHDLRNPLSTIVLGATAVLQSEELGPHSTKRVEMIQRAASRMEHLLRDLLDTASLQVGRLAIDKRPEDLASLVAEVADGYEQIAHDKSVTLRRECHLAGVVLACDRGRMMQALGNLLGNAVKFSRPGDTVSLSCFATADAVQLAVRDTGPGIAPQDLPHIFLPYWSGKRHAIEGTGLGLYICKGIVEAHDGRLEVESTLGVGTTFTVTLPRGPV